MSWKVPKLWDECWILGGGTSVPLQFNVPENIVKDVCSKKKDLNVYLPYFKFLENKNVIGINNAYLLGEKIVDVCFFGDSGWFKKHRVNLKKRKMLKATCIRGRTPDFLKEYGVKLLERESNSFGISNNNGYVCWNSNSGAASISLAHHLGAKKIYLLGFDMFDEDKVTHWHAPHFDKYTVPPYKKHLVGFKQIKMDADKLGIEIINVSPKSKIKEFTKVSLKDIA